MIHEGSSP